MMSAKATTVVIRAHFGIFRWILAVFIFSGNASSLASSEGCVAAGCSVGTKEVVTEAGERQR